MLDLVEASEKGDWDKNDDGFLAVADFELRFIDILADVLRK